MRRKRKRRARPRPELSVVQILAWADALQERTGRWPHAKHGVIAGSLGENWGNVDMALRKGSRGLPGGTTLARLLFEHRGKPNRSALPRWTIKQILAWADTFRQRTGRWPHAKLGVIAALPAENWNNIDMALRKGYRGLPGGTTLARLLFEHRGKRNKMGLPRFTIKQILAWADAYHRRTSQWPTKSSGPIAEAPGETWYAVNQALNLGGRGLPAGSSLPRLLAKKRGKRHLILLPRLTLTHILALADEFFRKHGQWPKRHSGPVDDAAGGTWYGISTALEKGCRGLPGGCSLARLLADKRGVRNQADLPALSNEKILAWAEAHFLRTGAWPSAKSGPVHDAPGETWAGINFALRDGYRGLQAGRTLFQLLTDHLTKSSAQTRRPAPLHFPRKA